MTKAAKTIWIAAAGFALFSLFFNLRPIPQEMPTLSNGEFLCPPEKQREADKLKPSPRMAEELRNYPRLIENAPSPTEAWRLSEESKKKATSYNQQVKAYNKYLRQNCHNN